MREIAVRTGADGTRDLCFACYAQTPRRVCGVCGELAAIQVRGRDGQPDICRRCYRPPVDRCHVCGRDRPCVFAGTPAAVCWSCKPRRIDRCAACGQDRPIKAASPIGPLCAGCEWRRLRAKAVCARCGRLCRPALHPGTEVLCGDCAGVQQTRVCERCGTEDVTYDRGLCPACTLTDRLTRLRQAGDPAATAALDAYLAVLQGRPNALSVLQWLARPAGQAFTELIAGRVDLSHTGLDGLEPRKAIEQLRSELVHCGCLPARDETQVTFDRWVSDRLAELPAGPDARAVRAFATWKVGRELQSRRRRHGHRPEPLADAMPRRYLTAAIDLTAWLHDHQLALEDLDQARLDRWLVEHPTVTAHRTISPFISWLAREREQRLRLPPAPASTPTVAVDDADRLAAVARLIGQEAIDARVRLAGCLVALYAQPVARIVRLTTDHIEITADAARLRLGGDAVVLPAPLQPIAEAVLDAQRDGWLFPGQQAGRPMHPTHLARRLRASGLPVAQTRPAGLAALAHRVPAAVLADMLGLSTSTTCRAAADLRVDYARYVARRP